MENSKRIYFMDALRAFVITLVIFYHVTIHYAQQFQVMPFVQNVIPRESNTFFLFLVLAFNGQIMNAAMFFIAGYFALGPLIKKGAGHFLRDKFVRLGIPYLLGLVILSPVAGYIAARSWGTTKGFLNYWFYEFYKPENINPFHLWFIGILLVFFILLSLAFFIFRDRIRSAGIRGMKFPLRSVLLFIAVTTLLYFVINIFCSSINYTKLYVVNFQTVMLPVYAAYFLLGINAYRKDWFRTGYRPRIIPWTVSYLISTFLYLAAVIYEAVTPGIISLSVVNLLLVLFFNISVFSAVFFLLAFFQRFADGGSSFAKAISGSSYSTYIFHYIVVYALVYFAGNISLPVFEKYGLQLAAAILLSWGAGHFIRKAPVLDRIL